MVLVARDQVARDQKCARDQKSCPSGRRCMMEWEAPRGSEGAVRERPLRAEARFIWQGPPRRPAGSRLPQQLLALFKNSALATWEVHPGAGQDAPTRAFPQAAHLRPTMPATLRLHAAQSSAGRRMCTALTSWPHAGLGGLANPAGCRIGAAPPNMAGTGRALKLGNGAGPGPGRIPPNASGGGSSERWLWLLPLAVRGRAFDGWRLCRHWAPSRRLCHVQEHQDSLILL